jgi:hypothetical protein
MRGGELVEEKDYEEVERRSFKGRNVYLYTITII